MELIEEIGINEIYRHNTILANRLRAGLSLPESNSAIVSMHRPGGYERLCAAGIQTAERSGQIRFSFHIYTTEHDVDAALDVLAA